jgi:hypothetical protein
MYVTKVVPWVRAQICISWGHSVRKWAALVYFELTLKSLSASLKTTKAVC